MQAQQQYYIMDWNLAYWKIPNTGQYCQKKKTFNKKAEDQEEFLIL